jgi:hypothetical protein
MKYQNFDVLRAIQCDGLSDVRMASQNPIVAATGQDGWFFLKYHRDLSLRALRARVIFQI